MADDMTRKEKIMGALVRMLAAFPEAYDMAEEVGGEATLRVHIKSKNDDEPGYVLVLGVEPKEDD